jgi:hypothetical protein
MIYITDDDIKLTLSGDPLLNLIGALEPLFVGIIHNAILSIVCIDVKMQLNA